MRSKRLPAKSKGPAHDTPVLGPRRRPTKVRSLASGARRRGDYDPGFPRPRRGSPWVDEGTPEPNG